MSLDPEIALAAANHWIAKKYPTFKGPKLSGFPAPEISDWHVARTVPLHIDLSDFSSLDQFAPCLKCAIDYLEKLLREAFIPLAKFHTVAAIEFTCGNTVDLTTNSLSDKILVVNGRLIAKPKEKSK